MLNERQQSLNLNLIIFLIFQIFTNPKIPEESADNFCYYE
jgi:hypothetical protein